ncbi:MAG: hypothetical protein A2Z04_08250 [Chloroflexi bacterium RBG_16_57_9]|nr:MAG: hypothetical protein A2Z04_08250 [Chloroflexi bacterium RBG_16_57_9]
MATNRTTLPQFFPLHPRVEGVGFAVDTRLLGLMVAGLVVFSLASVLYLSQASYVTTTSRRIQTLDKQLQDLQHIKARRMQELAEMTAPARLDDRARALGYGPPKRMVYVNIGTGVVGPQAQGSAVVNPEQQRTTERADFVTRLKMWFGVATVDQTRPPDPKSSRERNGP